jgi:hypothetical protein
MRRLAALCFHRWGFPRRCAQYGGQQNVDVQTCLKCGAKRVSLVQFGRAEVRS